MEMKDKQLNLMSTFSKIARMEKKREEAAKREAKRNGKPFYIEDPDTLPLKERLEYYRIIDEYEKKVFKNPKNYSQDDPEFPFPYKFI